MLENARLKERRFDALGYQRRNFRTLCGSRWRNHQRHSRGVMAATRSDQRNGAFMQRCAGGMKSFMQIRCDRKT